MGWWMMRESGTPEEYAGEMEDGYGYAERRHD